MHPRPTIPSFGLALRLAFPLALLFLTPACQTSPAPSTNASHSEPTATDTSTPATLPLATLGPDPLWPRDLAPALSEAAGALVLEELILDRSLALALRRAGLTITRADIERERTLLIDTIASDSGTDGNAAARSLNAIRAQRGLGPARFEALLSRNASLRALARSEADTRRAAATTRTGEGAQAAATEDAFRNFLDQEFGGRVRARVIVLPTADAATRLRDRILTESARAPQPDAARRVAFAEAAFEESIDPSTASRGGLLGPVSPSDPTLAPAIAAALRTVEPMQLSGVLSLERTFGLVLVESRDQGRAPTKEEASTARERFNLRREREAMDALARRLVAGPNPTIFDEHLNWSWESRPKR